MKKEEDEYKVGMLVTCSFPFREKEANVVRKITAVQRLFNKKTLAYTDVVLCADGGSSGKPINWVDAHFFTIVKQPES